ncbi:odorant receptor 7a-like [Rhagoletis pomonella]|uniref:odorant receptor 7a-like n=1 Tax=Rhagoletis pomonella TaxID=28610 RepID=UPI00177CDC30|nr:odorant receptor 7a-like [Rhagoletis pomonella]
MANFLPRQLRKLVFQGLRPDEVIVAEVQPPAEPVLSNAQLIRLQFERATRTPVSKRESSAQEEHEVRPYGAVHDIHSKDGLTYLFRSFMALGVLMPEKYKFLYCLYALLPLGLITFYLPAAFVLSYFKLDYSTIKIGNLLTSVQVSIASFVGAIKLCVMAFKLPKLRAGEAIMSELDARCKDEDEIEVLRKVVRQGNRLLVYILICNLIYSTSTFLGATLKGRPPYDIYNPVVDWRKSKWQFVWAALWEFILMDGLCAEEAITDSYAPIYVCIIRAHMKTLLMRLQKLGSNPERSREENYEDLKMCIRDHKSLLKLFDIVHPIISTTYFLQFMTTSLMVGCTLLNIMIFAVDNSARIGHLCYVVALLMEVYPLCYYGQSLLDDSNSLANTIFHGRWVDQNEDFRKMLVIFTQHTQKPMELLAGKLIPINLTTFVRIAKFSFTLYSFINNMGVKERFEGL